MFDAPGRRLVFEVPAFANDPYLSVANRADLGGERVVALDVDGHRLDVFDRFSRGGRSVYLARAYHHYDDFLGRIVIDRVALTAIRAPAIAVDMHAFGPKIDYVRVGTQTRVLPMSASASVLRPADLPANGSVAELAFGIFTDREHLSWLECRTEARGTPSGVEILTPCDGYQHYVFPNGRSATSREDVSPRLDVVMRPS